jgi:hypothetical protein
VKVRIGAIVIHCFQFDRTVAFWREALHYVPRNPASADWVVLCDPTGRGPNVSFQARDIRAGRRIWVHLDLYTDQQKPEVERLVALGATRYPWQYPAGADYVVLEDPDGNLFASFKNLRWPNQGDAAKAKVEKEIVSRYKLTLFQSINI